ncbi:uncharacterized protein I206_100527 [Kwoniella pini CBS 10737]|uniref:Uncharacterized protein n=1 Tax=Kwoniella pini CBS 10737 TaxID=1296096 RepID=A0A1B9ICX0_9TREE|nr:uncharacterized protein I206_00800 [Kwoniella pini CBS 10737]OCF53495.1 hypothetical protein I206_00800 [Kwoniella pini CBS 10737]
MSTSTDIPIDPSLREISIAEPPKSAGTKRKARGSNNNAAASPSTSSGRATRRSAVNNINAENAYVGEPTRGEEENLNGYWAPTNTKRARRSSPTKRSRPSSSSTKFQASPNKGDGSLSGNAGPSGTSYDSGLSLAGIEDLAAAAIAANGKGPGLLSYIPMYPIGLTPFRYPCLKPIIPNPPPGDPNDPNFKPFNPHATPVESTSSSDYTNLQNQESNLNPNIDPQLNDLANLSRSDQQQSLQNLPSSFDEDQQQRNPIIDQDTAASADAAFESISALLSASQGVYPTLDSIDYGQNQ